MAPPGGQNSRATFHGNENYRPQDRLQVRGSDGARPAVTNSKSRLSLMADEQLKSGNPFIELPPHTNRVRFSLFAMFPLSFCLFPQSLTLCRTLSGCSVCARMVSPSSITAVAQILSNRSRSLPRSVPFPITSRFLIPQQQLVSGNNPISEDMVMKIQFKIVGAGFLNNEHEPVGEIPYFQNCQKRNDDPQFILVVRGSDYQTAVRPSFVLSSLVRVFSLHFLTLSS